MSRDISMAEGESQTPITADADDTAHRRVDDAGPLALELERSAPFATSGSDPDKRPDHRLAEDLNQNDEEAMREAELSRLPGGNEAQSTAPKPVKRKQVEEENMSEGIMVALSKLRKQ
jgi:DNA excision repair protein ERCC-1